MDTILKLLVLRSCDPPGPTQPARTGRNPEPVTGRAARGAAGGGEMGVYVIAVMGRMNYE